ncbi:MAG: DUF6285 domain-containing protein [Deltaproteobacteria bacterium]|nr:DUF6285 domain-containing protein [Deltaproteobacteria bacterium]
MQDRPTLAELIDAVRGFLDREVVPALDGTAKFHARVAANVLAIVGRELAHEPAQLTAEWRRLDALLGAEPLPPAGELRDALLRRNEALCARIRAGDADAGALRSAVLAHVRETVREKLLVANPKLLAASAEETT